MSASTVFWALFRIGIGLGVDPDPEIYHKNAESDPDFETHRNLLLFFISFLFYLVKFRIHIQFNSIQFNRLFI
jgi:hypothetical protein